MRARHPDRDGVVQRDGVRIFYEVFGSADAAVLLLPTWSIVHSRAWKMQVPYLARHFRVVTFDARGNGRSDRPAEPAAYSEHTLADDAVAVMDATGIDRAVVVGHSMGAQRGLILAAEHPDRVAGLVLICPATPLPPASPRAGAQVGFDEPPSTTEGWAKFNRHYWRDHFEDFLRFFFSQVFTEPHSTKPIEDAVGWGLETTPAVLAATAVAPGLRSEADLRAAVKRVRCPTLVIHGTDDAIRTHRSGRTLAEALEATFISLDGSGHSPHARDPVKVNALVRTFAAGVTGGPPVARRWTRGRRRARRALYISSPIGLGHARRDVAIADELRARCPDLQIDWLAQHPVTRVLEERGERIHPASRFLASEVAHIDDESAEHDLHCFQTWRRMDEILLANFMVLQDLLDDEPYDLLIGDEAWELDYYLHENPDLKRTAYAWLTDFVGWLPMPDGGEHEAFLTADYNAEMIEHVARFPRVRDRAIFVGSPEDIVPDRFGPGLPRIRDWTEAHYRFSGYITGFDPTGLADRAAVREALGYRSGEKICIVTVGGSGAGGMLLRRIIDAYPAARARVPELRMVVVAGPRIDPAALPSHDGLDVRAYVPELYRHLAACDLAVVQGGLTTCMELTANRRPFLYFPLRHHCEQNFHVRYRLDRYRAGRCMDYGTAGPEVIAQAIGEELDRPVGYRPVETDGAARAATLLAELL